ncbi:hypothetical protein OPIT5_07235 [Opitutaceae bacterium TAV5]|nr:hypothetical protein OPIT5_07235 [Opitutaceae bacterium TAV5]
MKSQPVEYLERIEDDLLQAFDFYDSWLADGAEKFTEKFDDAIRWIEWNPELYPKKYRFYRRVILQRSYYAVYYVIEERVTTVVAVLDMRQEPKRIRQMLEARRKLLRAKRNQKWRR